MNLRSVVTPFFRSLLEHQGDWRSAFDSNCIFSPYDFAMPSKDPHNFYKQFGGRRHWYEMMSNVFIEFATARVCPAIVHVSTQKGIGRTGIIIDSEGTILTRSCNIFSRDARSKINVSLVDGRRFSGTILKDSKDHCLTLLKIQSESPLPITRFGSLNDCHGKELISIELPRTSADHRRHSRQNKVDEESYVPTYDEYLDEVEFEKHCLNDKGGGPIVNLDGEVIGVSTFIHIIRSSSVSGYHIGNLHAMPIGEAFRKVGYVNEWSRNYGQMKMKEGIEGIF